MQRYSLSSARTLASVGIFAALTFLATFVIKIPTPTFGYIHIGDCFVLLSGLLLGPVCGGLAAGIGSALSDLLAGYAVWVPGTFLIKFLTAAVAAKIFVRLRRISEKKAGKQVPVSGTSSVLSKTAFPFLPSAVCGELVMTAGYFLYNILIVSFFSSTVSAGLAAAAAVSLAEIPFNLIQGAAGIVLAAVLYPVFVRATARSHLRTI